jgi:hypothetical protein
MHGHSTDRHFDHVVAIAFTIVVQPDATRAAACDVEVTHRTSNRNGD